MQGLEQYEKRVLVTGGAGFIGSNYLNYAAVKYPHYFFVVVDALTAAADLESLSMLDAQNYAFEWADIRNRAALDEIFARYAITDVIHFAAESHVDVSIEDPALFVRTNIVGTHNLLLLSRAHGVNRFHQISTDEVYGSLGPNDPPCTETSTLAPRNPYSASKASADLLVRSYHETFGLNAVVTRASNNYGPNQDRTKLLPLFIGNLLSDATVPLYGDGANIRDWLFVEDHVRAIDLVFQRGVSGEVYNIGGNQEFSNLDVTRRLLALLGKDESSIESVPDRLGHDFRYALDSNKLMQELGWKPRVSFEEGLALTVEHYCARFGVDQA